MIDVTLESTDFISSNSYAKVARNHALFLERHSLQVAVRSRQRPRACAVNASLAEYLADLERRPDRGLRIHYGPPGAMTAHPGGVCMTPFETATLNPHWVHAARRLRKLFVHCHASRDLLVREGLPPRQVGVVHHGYDPAIYRPDAPPLRRSGKYTFIYVGHYNARKCVDRMVNAYCAEFRQDEPVELLLYVQRQWEGVDVENRIARITAGHPRPPSVTINASAFDAGLPEEQMGSLYRSGDCLVYPSMGEGFGLPALEARACGLEVVATRCSGMLDFLDDDCAHLVDVEAIRPEPACEAIDREYHDLKFWIPSEASLREQMRAVFEGSRRSRPPEGWTWDRRLAHLPEQITRLGDRGLLLRTAPTAYSST